MIQVGDAVAALLLSEHTLQTIENPFLFLISIHPVRLRAIAIAQEMARSASSADRVQLVTFLLADPASPAAVIAPGVRLGHHSQVRKKSTVSLRQIPTPSDRNLCSVFLSRRPGAPMGFVLGLLSHDMTKPTRPIKVRLEVSLNIEYPLDFRLVVEGGNITIK
jgi:hypothetical protein